MGFSVGNFATIKQVENKGNYTTAKITISKKDKKLDKYVCSFSGWATFVGDAHLCKPQAEQRIKILQCDVSNGYADSIGEQKWSAKPQFTVYKYELQSQNGSSNGNSPALTPMDFVDFDTDTDLPF